MSKHRVLFALLAAAVFSTAVYAADAKKAPTLADKTAAKPATDAGAADAGTAKPAPAPAPADAGTAKVPLKK
jgi:hypothetical protein